MTRKPDHFCMHFHSSLKVIKSFSSGKRVYNRLGGTLVIMEVGAHKRAKLGVWTKSIMKAVAGAT